MRLPAAHPRVATADGAENRSRRLKELVRHTRLIGGLFAVLGGLVGFPVLWISGLRGEPIVAMVALSLFASGLAYIAFGWFLKRRYWAWLAVVILSGLMLVLTLGTGLSIVVRLIAEVLRSNDVQLLLAGIGPMVMFGCWSAGLVMMLVSLRRALPSIREAEAEGQTGFGVIPVARVAETVAESSGD